MSNRTSISLGDEAWAFLLAESGKNNSSFIEALLLEKKYSTLKDAILRANEEEAMDEKYHAETELWDATTGDGL